MSAVAGFFRFDGAPVDDDDVARMAARIEARGYRPTSQVIDHFALIGGRESNLAVGESHAIAFDGRLDNREDLRAALRIDRAADDATIALRAFQQWGPQFAARLDGDFAIGAINRTTREVVCARDHFGVRCLFYRTGPGWIAFATSIDVITAGIAPLPDVNEGMAGEYLSSFIVNTTDTLFENVHRVAPASCVTTSSGRISREEYWTPAPQPLRRRTDGDYEDELRQLLRDAVIRRLRDARVVGVMLSGGLDSSAVTGLAAEAVRDRSVITERLETFSGSVPGPDDERAFADAVSEKWRAVAHVVTEQQPRAGEFAEEIALDLEPQMFPHTPTIDVLRARARDRGVRVMLTGNGADDWFGSGPAAYADLFTRLRWVALINRIRHDVDSDLFAGWRLALQSIVWPVLPGAAQDAARTILGRGKPPAWIDPAFARRIALEDRLAQFRSRRRFATRELDDNWFQTMHGLHLHASEVVTRGGDRFGLELAHPFFDRRLVEFALTLPPEQLWRNGRAKDLLRRTMQPHLPPAVAARRTSPAADHAFIHAIESAAGERPFADLEAVRRGWLNAAAVATMWDTMRARRERAAREGRILWGIQAVDLWLQARTMVKYTRRLSCV